ncbi:MAG: hypothetical protein IT580_02235, partial [Verrucomicrobiales bacterium]|nr:hypothetical protein [Verrucomicrobiales bacterium]
GILMVHETPDSTALGWSGAWWCVLMYASAIAAFASVVPRGGTTKEAGPLWPSVGRGLRAIGLVGLLVLAWVFRGADGERIVTLSPFSISTQWYGILGLIGWAYGVACLVYLAFARRPMAMLGCQALLLCLFAADRAGGLDALPIPRWVGWGDTIGSLGSIAVSGLLFGTVVLEARPEAREHRGRFVLCFVVGCALAALMLGPVYGIQKNLATPSWSLWACAITGLMWWGVHHLVEAWPALAVARFLGWAGRNVLLAYLISEMLPSLIQVMGAAEFYARLAGNLPAALVRSAVCAVGVLATAVVLNRAGFRLRL